MGSFFIPVKIGPEQLVSNVPLDADAEKYGEKWRGEWAVGTTYAKGQVIRQDVELYESVADSNAGNNPEQTSKGEGAAWIHLGKINRLRMFDKYVGSDTTAPASTGITVVISDIKADQLALFNARADKIKVEILDAADVPRWTYEKDVSTGRDVGTWYEFFFAPFPPEITVDEIVRLPWMLRSHAGEKIKITLSGKSTSATETIACGSCDMGIEATLGLTKWDASSGALYFGARKRDQWGRVSLRHGETAKLVKCELHIPRGSENYAARMLSGLLDKTAVFDLNNQGCTKYEPLIVKGFLITHWESLKTVNNTVVAMDIEGLI